MWNGEENVPPRNVGWRQAVELLRRGDYVLATKYVDGDPGDEWFLGFYGSEMVEYRDLGSEPRFDVLDEFGRSKRANGFRRVRAVSIKTGAFITKNRDRIASCGLSLWHFERNAIRLAKMRAE